MVRRAHVFSRPPKCFRLPGKVIPSSSQLRKQSDRQTNRKRHKQLKNKQTFQQTNKKPFTHKETDSHTDRQADRQTESHTDRQTDRQTSDTEITENSFCSLDCFAHASFKDVRNRTRALKTQKDAARWKEIIVLLILQCNRLHCETITSR